MIAPWQGYEPRRWQREAFVAARSAISGDEAGVVSAVMGAGKSFLIAELAARYDGRVVITVPTQSLVRQLAKTVRARTGECGEFYGKKKDIQRVTVVCQPSALKYAEQVDDVFLWISDEAHRSEANQVKAFFDAAKPQSRLAVTATPFRGDPNETLSLWDRCIYRYGFDDAIRDGVLVPVRPINYDGTGDDNANRVCYDMIRAHGYGPGIVSATDIEDAEWFAKLLTSKGIPAAAIHSRVSSTDQLARIERLRGGELRCLVHVSMLVEGVDFPWLRWLCLRRPVSSRVRFLQEVGRVLRSHPGKHEAVLMDPYDLLGALGMDTPEALGAAIDAPPESKSKSGPAAEPLPTELPAAVAIDMVTQYIRQLRLAMAVDGIIAPPSVSSTHWRTRKPTQAQLGVLVRAKKACRWIPAEHREALRPWFERPPTRGAASDLIDIATGYRMAAVKHKSRTGSWKGHRPPSVEGPEAPGKYVVKTAVGASNG